MVATLIPERRDSSAILISELSAVFGIAPLPSMSAVLNDISRYLYYPLKIVSLSIEGNDMDAIEFAAVLVTGFFGSAEFGSATLVHPVIRRLSTDAQLAMEKGLLTTFGRVMPVGMTVATALAIIIAINDPSAWLTSAAISLGLALTVTIIGNVPINARTGRISADTAPAGFIAMRRRWDVFQIVRASLQLLGFVLVTIGVLG